MMTGAQIGDLIRSWEVHHNVRLSERRWESAFRTASAVAGRGMSAVTGAIHGALASTISH